MKLPSRRWWFRAGLGLLLALVAIQFVPYGHSRVNPAIAAEPAWDSPATRALAKQACFDCQQQRNGVAGLLAGGARVLADSA